MVFERKFLWLPKKIDGKLYWLKKVMVFTDNKIMSIDGKIVTIKNKKYIVEG